jgi:MSHA biogenesis protein MshO
MIRKNTIFPGTCKYPHQQGFTLLELIIVIMILGVIGSGTAVMLMNTFTAMESQISRAELAADADRILNRMVREIRMSDPKNITIETDQQSIEFHTLPSELDGSQTSSLPDQARACEGPAASFNPNCNVGPVPHEGDEIVYYCDGSGGVFRKSSGESGTDKLMAESVSGCKFTDQGGGLVSLYLEIERDGEKIALQSKVRVLNQ